MLYEMLTGRAPFSTGSPASVMYRIVHAERDSLREVNPGIPGYLEGIIGKACTRGPAQRYRSAREMIGDLQAERTPKLPEGTEGGTVLKVGVPS